MTVVGTTDTFYFPPTCLNNKALKVFKKKIMVYELYLSKTF